MILHHFTNLSALVGINPGVDGAEIITQTTLSGPNSDWLYGAMLSE